MKLAPDLSVLTSGILSKKKELTKVLIHEAAVKFLEKEARANKSLGHFGLEQVSALGKLGVLSFVDTKTRCENYEDVNTAIRNMAFDEDAVLCTTDEIQARIAEAKGIKVMLEKKKGGKIRLEDFFDAKTMSVHLKTDMVPHAKRGKPGLWSYDEIQDTQLDSKDIEEIAREITETAQKSGFIEIDRTGSTIIQLYNFRIVITRPPFSETWEITAVRPVIHLSLDDYSLTEQLKTRISDQAEGVLIAGSPGMGKSTFAAALAEFYNQQNKIVKTVEAPRDLVLPKSVTQYAISHGDPQEIHDVLLLSRPDCTFFDEMRNTDDFRLFADLRLAGIGFIGVVHATNPVDAVQRFVGRIELGVIPQVIDTVIFIKDGRIDKVLSLQMMVKVPSGMTEADLARPVVVVTDFQTGCAEFELYSYGEETVVIPVTDPGREPALRLAEKQLNQDFSKYSKDIEVEVKSANSCTVYAPDDIIPKLIGTKGKNISELETRFGMSINVQPLVRTDTIEFDVRIMSKSIIFSLHPKHADREVNIAVDGDYLLTAKVSRKGAIKVKKGNKIGRIIENAANTGEGLSIVAS